MAGIGNRRAGVVALAKRPLDPAAHQVHLSAADEDVAADAIAKELHRQARLVAVVERGIHHRIPPSTAQHRLELIAGPPVGAKALNLLRQMVGRDAPIEHRHPPARAQHRVHDFRTEVAGAADEED